MYLLDPRNWSGLIFSRYPSMMISNSFKIVKRKWRMGVQNVKLLLQDLMTLFFFVLKSERPWQVSSKMLSCFMNLVVSTWKVSSYKIMPIHRIYFGYDLSFVFGHSVPHVELEEVEFEKKGGKIFKQGPS